jgi:hypothetical protein
LRAETPSAERLGEEWAAAPPKGIKGEEVDDTCWPPMGRPLNAGEASFDSVPTPMRGWGLREGRRLDRCKLLLLLLPREGEEPNPPALERVG